MHFLKMTQNDFWCSRNEEGAFSFYRRYSFLGWRLRWVIAHCISSGICSAYRSSSVWATPALCLDRLIETGSDGWGNLWGRLKSVKKGTGKRVNTSCTLTVNLADKTRRYPQINPNKKSVQLPWRTFNATLVENLPKQSGTFVSLLHPRVVVGVRWGKKKGFWWHGIYHGINSCTVPKPKAYRILELAINEKRVIARRIYLKI